MPPTSNMTITRKLRRQVLNLLADLYLFPQSDRVLTEALRDRAPDMDRKAVRDCFAYLEKKGYVVVNRSHAGAATARITSKGVDLIEGAATDRGVLSATSSDRAALSVKRQIRAAVLSYLRLFPESFNGDDEIHAELVEMGMAALPLDQVRYHIWYLAGKDLLEMKTHPLHGDMIYLARITARGMDVADGGEKEDGVTCDE